MQAIAGTQQLPASHFITENFYGTLNISLDFESSIDLLGHIDRILRFLKNFPVKICSKNNVVQDFKYEEKPL